MKISRKIFVVLAFVVSVSPTISGCGSETSGPDTSLAVTTDAITVDGEWATTGPMQSDVGVYMNITSSDENALVGASVDTSIAEMAQVHETTTASDGSTGMREIKSIPMTAGTPLALVSGGYHIMLIKLAAPLESGKSSVAVTLMFKSGETKVVDVPVLVGKPETTPPESPDGEKSGGDKSKEWPIFVVLLSIVVIFALVKLAARLGILQPQKPNRSVKMGRNPRRLEPESLVPIGTIPDTFPESKTPLKVLLGNESLTKKLPKATASPVTTPAASPVTTPIASPVTTPIASPVTTPAATVRPTLSTSVKSNSRDTENLLDERLTRRAIISPPQIAEPSSFARHDWWDKDREWCQVSPLGMSNDAVCDIGTSGALAIAAVSLRGHKHKVDSKACQDAFSLRVATSQSGEKFLIVVVCDGMSSAKYSHYGARRTSQLLARSLAEIISFEESVVEQSIRSRLPKAFEICRKILVPRSGNQYGAPDVPADGAVESDFYTTVTFMILPSAKQANGKVNVIVGYIGDSPVFALRAQTGEWEEIGGLGTNADIVNPATSAFPAVIDARITTVVIDEQDVIIATSDGVGNFLNVRGGQTLLGSYLAQQWIRPVNLPTFINDVGFDLRSADDDRTVVAIWPNRG